MNDVYLYITEGGHAINEAESDLPRLSAGAAFEIETSDGQVR
jgi:hypothetical protein